VITRANRAVGPVSGDDQVTIVELARVVTPPPEFDCHSHFATVTLQRAQQIDACHPVKRVVGKRHVLAAMHDRHRTEHFLVVCHRRIQVGAISRTNASATSEKTTPQPYVAPSDRARKQRCRAPGRRVSSGRRRTIQPVRHR